MRIKKLKIYSTDIGKQEAFYTGVLGVQLVGKTPQSITFQIGNSILEIEQKKGATPYHFAINIPCNKENEALGWLQQKVPILKDGKQLLQDFDNWNAKAMYFYDQDLNIVELIARKNLNNDSAKEFNVSQFLEISEIGLPTLQVEDKYNILHTQTGIEIYDGGFDRFAAIGDEHGLFICINKTIKNWFPTGDKSYSSEFEIEFVEQNNPFHFEFKEDVLKLVP